MRYHNQQWPPREPEALSPTQSPSAPGHPSPLPVSMPPPSFIAEKQPERLGQHKGPLLDMYGSCPRRRRHQVDLTTRRSDRRCSGSTCIHFCTHSCSFKYPVKPIHAKTLARQHPTVGCVGATGTKIDERALVLTVDALVSICD